MRGKYAEISDKVWNNALDYPGKEKVDPSSYRMPDKRTDEEKMTALDEMIERQNARFERAERLRLAAQGKKIIKAAEKGSAGAAKTEEVPDRSGEGGDADTAGEQPKGTKVPKETGDTGSRERADESDSSETAETKDAAGERRDDASGGERNDGADEPAGDAEAKKTGGDEQERKPGLPVKPEQRFTKDNLSHLAECARKVGQRSGDLNYYRYLRAAAEKWNVSGPDLLQNARERNKESLFGEDRNMSFYCSMSLEEAMKMLQAGELDSKSYTGTDVDGAEPRLMHFSYDHKRDDGTYENGFGDERAAASREVTFVLDGSMIDEADFECGTKFPTINKLNLQKYCLGIVAEEQGSVQQLIDVAQTEEQCIPVYLNKNDDWANRQHPVSTEYMRSTKVRTAETHQKLEALRERMRDQIFEHVDRSRLEREVSESLERITEKDLDEMTDYYVRAGEAPRNERNEAWDVADANVTRIIRERLGIDHPVTVEYVNDPKLKFAGRCDGHGANILINRAHVKPGNITDSIHVIAHELRHSYQFQQSDLADGMSDSMQNLYKMNYNEYITSDVDDKGYRTQLVEFEAENYGISLRDMIYDRYNARFGRLQRLRMKLSATVSQVVSSARTKK